MKPIAARLRLGMHHNLALQNFTEKGIVSY